MVDAASLAFRLHLRGVDLGARAESIADAWSDPSYYGYYAFNDVHAVMAFVVAGRLDPSGVVRELEGERRRRQQRSHFRVTSGCRSPGARGFRRGALCRLGARSSRCDSWRMLSVAATRQRDASRDQTLTEAAERGFSTTLRAPWPKVVPPNAAARRQLNDFHFARLKCHSLVRAHPTAAIATDFGLLDIARSEGSSPGHRGPPA